MERDDDVPRNDDGMSRNDDEVADTVDDRSNSVSADAFVADDEFDSKRERNVSFISASLVIKSS